MSEDVRGWVKSDGGWREGGGGTSRIHWASSPGDDPSSPPASMFPSRSDRGCQWWLMDGERRGVDERVCMVRGYVCDVRYPLLTCSHLDLTVDVNGG